jgi:hypothetical protein
MIINVKKNFECILCLIKHQVNVFYMSKKFHPFVFMVTKREKAKDYAFMFKCIRDALKTIYEFDY